MWFVLTMSLVLIGMGVGWYFSCGDESALCRTSRAFSPGPVLFGLMFLWMAGIIFWEDRKRPKRRRGRRRSGRRNRIKLV